MTQNIYDDPAFFQGYSQMARSIGGLDSAPEWPALKAMLPPMQGLKVVDLGRRAGATHDDAGRRETLKATRTVCVKILVAQ